jgi:hypothetical protein
MKRWATPRGIVAREGQLELSGMSPALEGCADPVAKTLFYVGSS